MVELELDTNDGHGSIKSEPAPKRKNFDQKSRTDPESKPAL
jgi:hypothetical protein